MSKASLGSSPAHMFEFALITKVLRGFARRRGVREMKLLDDFMLKDIGLTRADIFSAAHGKVERRD